MFVPRSVIVVAHRIHQPRTVDLIALFFLFFFFSLILSFSWHSSCFSMWRGQHLAIIKDPHNRPLPPPPPPVPALSSRWTRQPRTHRESIELKNVWMHHFSYRGLSSWLVTLVGVFWTCGFHIAISSTRIFILFSSLFSFLSLVWFTRDKQGPREIPLFSTLILLLEQPETNEND